MYYYSKDQPGKYVELTWVMYKPNGSSLWVRVNYATYNLVYTWVNVSTEKPDMDKMTEIEARKLMKLIFKIKKLKQREIKKYES
jgi:hypothetical protein